MGSEVAGWIQGPFMYSQTFGIGLVASSRTRPLGARVLDTWVEAFVVTVERMLGLLDKSTDLLSTFILYCFPRSSVLIYEHMGEHK